MSARMVATATSTSSSVRSLKAERMRSRSPRVSTRSNVALIALSSRAVVSDRQGRRSELWRTPTMEAPLAVSNLAVMALEVAGVSVRFGGLTALDDVSLAVAPGEGGGGIGPNGPGQTTLFNVICGYVRPDAGEVRFDGAPLPARPYGLTRHGIARTLQGVGLFTGLTAVENVMVGVPKRAGTLASLLGLPNADRREREARAL